MGHGYYILRGILKKIKVYLQDDCGNHAAHEITRKIDSIYFHEMNQWDLSSPGQSLHGRIRLSVKEPKELNRTNK